MFCLIWLVIFHRQLIARESQAALFSRLSCFMVSPELAGIGSMRAMSGACLNMIAFASDRYSR